jgi:hypothetical protein
LKILLSVFKTSSIDINDHQEVFNRLFIMTGKQLLSVA